MQNITPSYSMTPIGIVHSPYKEKFGTPREPGLVKSGQGTIELFPNLAPFASVNDLLPDSKLWVIFYFHDLKELKLKAKIRPPRLGGSQRISLYATRAPHRINRLGLSLVHFHKTEVINGKPVLQISGHDLIDGTPVLDLKPYLYDYEAHPAPDHYNNDWKRNDSYLIIKEVRFSENADEILKSKPDLKEFIREYLAQDPRPAYHKGKNGLRGQYTNRIDNYDICWSIQLDQVGLELIQVDQLLELS